jgi:hypothetical protein
MITFKLDTREFNSAMDELRSVTRKEDDKIIRLTAYGVVLNLVRFTPIFKKIKNPNFQWKQLFVEKFAKGRARLGWWPAWKHLGIRGTPNIGNGPLIDRGEGGITDNSKNIMNPHITVYNTVDYSYKLDKKNNIVKRALDFQQRFLQRAIDRSYKKLLGRFGR